MRRGVPPAACSSMRACLPTKSGFSKSTKRPSRSSKGGALPHLRRVVNGRSGVGASAHVVGSDDEQARLHPSDVDGVLAGRAKAVFPARLNQGVPHRTGALRRHPQLVANLAGEALTAHIDAGATDFCLPDPGKLEGRPVLAGRILQHIGRLGPLQGENADRGADVVDLDIKPAGVHRQPLFLGPATNPYSSSPKRKTLSRRWAYRS